MYALKQHETLPVQNNNESSSVGVYLQQTPREGATVLVIVTLLITSRQDLPEKKSKVNFEMRTGL